MVVVGIIVLLAALAFPMVMRAYRDGRRARVTSDLQAIATALEAYKADHGDYPRVINPVADGSGNLVTNHGASVLGMALIGPGPAADTAGQPPTDGADGMGFRTRPSGKIHGPYLQPDKFSVDATGAIIEPQSQRPVLYYPGNPGRPNIRAAGGYVAVGDPGPPVIRPLYDANYNADLSLQHLQVLLGDLDLDGRINGNELPVFDGPYLLWSAGPDGFFGLIDVDESGDISDGDTTDDVTNFELPADRVKR